MKPTITEIANHFAKFEGKALTQEEILIQFIDTFGERFTEKEIAEADVLAAFMSATYMFCLFGQWPTVFLDMFPDSNK